MPATLPALDLTELLKGVPRGAWVAISVSKHEVVAIGSDVKSVIADAKAKGERDPLITRVPEAQSALML